MWVPHIPCLQYAEFMFDLLCDVDREVRWICGTYGRMREHNMVGLFRREDAHLTCVSNTIIGEMETGVTMAFY